ncbi:Neurotrypsin [Holothuria leucospilota]|uniref:Neurotrypsin n=1 Tax=Holothuria leucospilota TaxID=206669 RepID=A0A9Q1HCH9_HOLLE|nr:Neurotrypsin [Holothuria leucospilota]
MGRQFSIVLLLVFVGTCCCQDAVRLVGGNGPKEGRVEVFIAGEWGTICDDLWDINDGHVICRQLGYSGADTIRYFAYFGEGSGRIWLDNVECAGDEETIADCRRNQFGDHNCQHYEDAGVECSKQEVESVTEETIEDIRLVGGSTANVGRLEVLVDGRWGTVCDDDWDINDASVVCRQLGYPGADSAEGFAFFGQGSDPIWLDNVRCSGEEDNLLDCPKNDFGEHNCNHYEDAGVRCTRTETVAPTDVTAPLVIEDIRLVGGRSGEEGRLEVYVNGEWGTVCDDFWDRLDADVVCRQLGYTGSAYSRTSESFGLGEGRIWLDDVRCTGSEESLQDCRMNDIGDENCGHSEDVGVECIPLDDSTTTTSVVYLIFSEATSIQLIPLGENHQDPFPPLTNVNNVVAIAPVYSKTGIFFSDIYEGSILFRSLKENNTVTILEGIGSVEGIAYNHVTDEIFWTSYTNSSISRMKVFQHSTDEEEQEEVLIRMSPSDHPRGIALDICNSSIFWTIWSYPNPSIMTASMTGKDARAIITTEIQRPNGIIIDSYARKLYWCEAMLDKIERANLDGTNRVVITEIEYSHPFDLVIYENNLYWTDWEHREVRRVNRFTGENMTVVRSGLSRDPLGITILDEPHNCSALPCANNNGGCEEICDTDEYGAVKCSCMEGKRLTDDNHTCLTYYQDIRLTGGQSENEGRVEVSVKGEWGTVCDDIWDLDDAMVVCKELGYPGAEAYFTLAHFGEGTGVIWLDDVDCSGDENSLNDCKKNSIGYHDCSHSEDAGVTCTEKSNEYLIYSEVSSIQMISLGENRQDPIPLVPDGVYLISIAPVYSKRGFFFSDVYKRAIVYHSMRENNTVTILEGVGSVEGIAYNHVTDEIFWTSYTNSSISRMKVFPHSTAEEEQEEVLIRMSASDHPRGIALDICSSSIYWANWNEQDPSIMTASMRGEDYHAVITTDIALPNGIVIDTYASKLYWCDARLDKIERANLDGTNRVVIIDSDLVHPFDLAVHENSLYLTDWGRDEVIRVDKYTGGNLTVLRSGSLQNPMGISILEEPHNCSALPCSTVNGGCQEICATDEYGAIQCSCSPGKYLAHDNETCLISSLTTSSTAAPTTTVESVISTEGTLVIEDIRLVNGYSHNTGRVEVYVNGEWGTVCHDRWEREDAEVVCRWLGYTGADAAMGNAFFGEGTGPIWLDNVRCSGDEETLRECRMKPIGEHNCDHDEDAGVECTIVPTPFGPRPGNDYRDDLRCRGGYSAPNFGQARCNRNGAYPCCSPELWCGNTPEHCECEGCVDYRDSSVKDIRLSGPYPHAGKVEVFIFGEWGSVCNDYWDIEDANVACRMLGYSGADEIKRGDYYGEGYDPVVMDDVHCKGDEESLSDCPRNEPGYHDCDHRYEAASVVCTLPPSTTLPPPTTEGWAYRNDNRCGGNYRAPNGQIAKCDPNGIYPCCSNDNWCGNTPAHCECGGCHDYRITGSEYRTDRRCGSTFYAPNGNVAKCDPNGSYPCCSNYHWCGSSAAHCECGGCLDYRIQGSAYRIDRRCGNFLAPNGDLARCDPNGHYPCCSNHLWCGSSSAHCDCSGCIDYRLWAPLTTPSTAKPTTTVDSSINTKGTPVIEDIRLVNGYSHNTGRVEVYVNGEWGTVCHDRWEREDAEVVCRWLGYTGADAALGNAFFGEGTGPIWLDNVRCSGNEETLRECRMRPIGEHNCGHDEDAGVECTIVPTPFGPRPGNDYRDDLRCRGGYSAPNFGQARCNRNGAYPCCSPELWCGNTPEHCECEGCVDYRDSSVKDIRLRGPYPHAGKVEVFIFGEWGSVCNDYWDIEDANVACRMLGYSGADEIKRGDYYGEGYDPVLMDDVHCKGDEESLSDCPRNEPGYHDCDHRYEAASAVCTLPPSTTLPPPTTQDPDQDYRNDYRCGGDYLAPNGEVAKCKKDGQYPCCSPEKECGITSDHCDCAECVDYRYYD